MAFLVPQFGLTDSFSCRLSLVLHIPLSFGCNTYLIYCLTDAFTVLPSDVSATWLLLLQHPPHVGSFGDAIGNLSDSSKDLKPSMAFENQGERGAGLCHTTPLILVCVCVGDSFRRSLPSIPQSMLKYFSWPPP